MPENWNQYEGQVVNDAFPLRKFLGATSQSAVFLTDYAAPAGHQQAAIKLIAGDPQNLNSQHDNAQLARWQRVSDLSHPHLIRLLQMGRCELDGLPLLYVVMEFADETLSEILPQRALTPEETGDMLPPVLEALAYLHDSGFAHAAIKPSNIMAVGDQLKISSDRLIPIGERSRIVATPSGYEPPETLRGVISPEGKLSPETDVWSLGVTLVEVLTQTRPACEWASFEDLALPANLPQPFLDIARHCLRREAQRRWTLAQIAARMRPDAKPAPHEEPSIPRTAARQHHPRSTRRYALPVLAAALLAAIFFGPQLLRRNTRADAAPADVTAPNPSLAPQPAPTSPAASAPAPTLSSASGNDTIVERVMPDLAPAARKTIQGTIRIAIRVSVDPSGNVSTATFDVRGPSGYFADRAMAASRKWKFTPTKNALGYVPVNWLLRFEITPTTTNVFAALADQ